MAKIFYLLIIAQACSQTGGYIQTLALSWLAAELGGGLFSLAAYMIACYLPVALLSYPLGRFLDGKNQKPWLLAGEGSLAALSLLLYMASKKGWLNFPFLLIFGAGWGVIRALQTPIYQSLPRKLAKDLSKGAALLTAVTYGARGLGPILGGLLYAKAGQSAAFLANFISFLPSLLLLCFIKIPKAEPCEKIKVRKWIPPLLRIFTVCFLGVNYNITFVALARQGGLGSDAYGFALGLLGLGALLGFFLRARFKKELPFPLLIGGMGTLNLGLALGSGLWWQGGCILLYGILDFWFFAQSLYRLSGAARQGEQTAVMGLYTVATVGALPAGALFWSFAAKAAGLKVALWGIGGGLLIFALGEILQRMETNEKST